jgi:predicted nucleotidyltransferase
MKDLIKKLKPLLKNSNITDIIIFGSIVKSKISPGDIDVAVLVKEKNLEIRNTILKLIPDADVQLITIEDFENKIFLSLIKEGYSIKNNQYMHEIYKIRPIKMYKYSLKQLTSSQKVMFERGIKTIEGLKRLSNSVVLVPIEFTGKFESFLRQWDMDIDTEEYELVPLMRKEE